MSGKTTLAKNIYYHKDRLFTIPPELTIWIYQEIEEWHSDFKDRDDVIFLNDFDEVKRHLETEERTVMIIADDRTSYMLRKNSDMLTYFLEKVHHNNLIFVCVLHAIFVPNCRLANLQTSYLIITKMIRDVSSILRLSFQLKPLNTKFVYNAYMHAVSKAPFSHFVICLHAKDSELTRYRSTIFFWEDLTIYLPGNGDSLAKF